MARQLLFALSVLAFDSYVFAKPSEEPSVKIKIAVNTDKGGTHESVELVKEDGKWKALKDRNGRARQMSTLDIPLPPGIPSPGVAESGRTYKLLNVGKDCEAKKVVTTN